MALNGPSHVACLQLAEADMRTSVQLVTRRKAETPHQPEENYPQPYP